MDYSQYFDQCIKDTFLSMFDEELKLEKEIPSPGWIQSKGASILIGITGVVKGRILMDMPLSTARSIAAKLDPDMGQEDLALMTIAEALNISSGGAITKINNADKSAGFRLATPSIFSGTDSKIYTPNLNAVQLSYSTKFGTIDFYIGFEGV